MTIEITLDELIHLIETCRHNGGSIMYMTHSTDGKRCALLVSGNPHRKRRNQTAAPAPAPAQEG